MRRTYKILLASLLALPLISNAEQGKGFITMTTTNNELLCLRLAPDSQPANNIVPLAGMNVVADFCNAKTSPNWTVRADKRIQYGDSTFCLDVDTASYNPNQVGIWNCNGTPTNQLWSWQELKKKIILTSNSKCINSTGIGAVKMATNCSSTPNWVLKPSIPNLAVWITGKITSIYVDPSHIVVGLSGSDIAPQCKNKLLTLPRSNQNFLQMYELLLTSKVENFKVGLYVECNAERGTISHGVAY